MRRCGFFVRHVGLVVLLAATAAATAQQVETLVLPRDAARIDAFRRVGTQEEPGGLERLLTPDHPETLFYVVDQVAGLRGHVYDTLGEVYFKNADMVIASSAEFVHPRLIGPAEVIRMTFPEMLSLQLRALAESGGGLRAGLVEYAEQRVPLGECAGLTERVADLKTELGAAVVNVGARPPRDTMTLDGLSYDLRVRLGSASRATFRVYEDDQRLMPVVDSLVKTVRTCVAAIPADRQLFDF